jgi:hypothetical protein
MQISDEEMQKNLKDVAKSKLVFSMMINHRRADFPA